MSSVRSPKEVAASLTELWSPRVVAEVDDSYVKVAKVQGVFGWHAHEGEDELFLILKGHLRIDMESSTVELSEGDMFIVPKGVRHNPVAEHECHLMLIERILNVSPAVIDDFQELWPLLQAMGHTDTAEATAQRTRLIVQQSHHRLLVARVENALVGYAWAQDYGPHLRSGTSIVRLHDLYVLLAYRRRANRQTAISGSRRLGKGSERHLAAVASQPARSALLRKTGLTW